MEVMGQTDVTPYAEINSTVWKRLLHPAGASRTPDV